MSDQTVQSVSSESVSVTPHRWRAPQTDSDWMMVPSPRDITALLPVQAAERHASLQGASCRSLSALSVQARSETYAAAVDYTGKLLGDVPAHDSHEIQQRPWIIGGHQPILFHPGVWAKNFAQGWLAERTGAVSLNLIVDNDLLALPGVKVPTGPSEHPTTATELFGNGLRRQPWEEAHLSDESAWKTFPERITPHLQPWNIEPLLAQDWPLAVRHWEQTGDLVQALAAMRAQRERQWGLRNLELPISQLCQTPAFLKWMLCLCQRAEEFRTIHNAILTDYRHANHVTSPSHPVPDLARHDDWTEVPFWIWQAGDQQRGRLHVRTLGDRCEFSDGQNTLLTLPKQEQSAVQELQDWILRGGRIRMRALTTTLYCRVCLADVFVHGIGGAKYDEVTDQLIARYFKLPVPRYWTVTGTLRLPLGGSELTEQDLRLARLAVRDYDWNPVPRDRSAVPSELQAEFDEFQQLLSANSPNRRERHHRLAEIKYHFRAWRQDERPLLEQRIHSTAQSVAANRILKSREWSAWLFPETQLREFLRSPWR